MKLRLYSNNSFLEILPVDTSISSSLTVSVLSRAFQLNPCPVVFALYSIQIGFVDGKALMLAVNFTVDQNYLRIVSLFGNLSDSSLFITCSSRNIWLNGMMSK